MNIEEKLEKHRKLAIKLKEIKDEEMDLRVDIVEEIAKGYGVGTHNFAEYEGFKVKVANKLNYNISKVCFVYPNH